MVFRRNKRPNKHLNASGQRVTKGNQAASLVPLLESLAPVPSPYKDQHKNTYRRYIKADFTGPAAAATGPLQLPPLLFRSGRLAYPEYCSEKCPGQSAC